MTNMDQVREELELSLGRAPSQDEVNAVLIAKIMKLEQAATKATKAQALSLKISEKGALSIYGLGRFPVTLYKSQLEKLNAAWADIIAFADANADKMATKPVTTTQV